MINSDTFKYLILILVSSLWSSCSRPFQKEFFVKSAPSLYEMDSSQSFTFGYLHVPENRRLPTSRVIRLPVYIFKSRNPDPKTDPIIYTVGGPGSSTMPSARYMKYYQYLDDRDFILIEQRGTAYADPHLDCPEWAEAIYNINSSPELDDETQQRELLKAVSACRKRLTAKKIDLNSYHTLEIAADIEALRKTLKIEQYNLLTISYSTKIAQVLMRDYPEAIRSVVMDSPLPLEVNYGEESVDNIMESLNQVLDECLQQESCREAFPDIKNRYFTFLREKTDHPLQVTINHPKNNKVLDYLLQGKDLIQFYTKASTGEVVNIPANIDQLINDDLSMVREGLTQLLASKGNGAGMGMRLSVWCAEEYPFNSQQIITRKTTIYPEIAGLSPALFDADICKIWNVKAMKKSENKPIYSDIPVLLISGEYDHETPAKWAMLMKKNLNNSHHLIFKGWKHTPTTYWNNPCAMTAANYFFNNPDNFIVPECFYDIKPTIFTTIE